jgi:hypothetical protein
VQPMVGEWNIRVSAGIETGVGAGLGAGVIV